MRNGKHLLIAGAVALGVVVVGAKIINAKRAAGVNAPSAGWLSWLGGSGSPDVVQGADYWNYYGSTPVDTAQLNGQANADALASHYGAAGAAGGWYVG